MLGNGKKLLTLLDISKSLITAFLVVVSLIVAERIAPLDKAQAVLNNNLGYVTKRVEDLNFKFDKFQDEVRNNYVPKQELAQRFDYIWSDLTRLDSRIDRLEGKRKF